MAQSKQALRSRIKSVNSTKKITKAMEMIANAKLFKQRNKMEANRIYAQRLQDTVEEIVHYNPEVESALITKKKSPKKMSIVFCSDLGLCGAYNLNILKTVRDEVNKADPTVVIGTSLFRTMKEAGYNLIHEAPISSDDSNFTSIKEYVSEGVHRYLNDEVGCVQVIYTTFVNTMTFHPQVDTLLPCVIDQPKQVEQEGEKVDTLFEPNAKTILEQLIPMMIENVAYADWMESTTSEQGSRRVAMKTATDNANELSEELLLEYNKARQATITQEITEIVGGSSAV